MKIKLIPGEVTQSYDANAPTNYDSPRVFQSKYLGFVPDQKGKRKKLDGFNGNVHLFMNLDGSLVVYECDEINYMYWGGGEDEPAFPIGVRLSKSNFKPNDEEINYLVNLRNKSKLEREVA